MLEHLLRHFFLYFLLADLKSPCENKKYSPCHLNATCKHGKMDSFSCKCNKGFSGNGLTCKKRGIGFSDIFFSRRESRVGAVLKNAVNSSK